MLFQNTEGDQGIWITLAFALIPGFGVLLLNPNAYSLHGFYRDRLSKAFLFWVPTKTTEEPLPLDTMKLSDLINSDGPFPIVNAALNVQGSPSANMRGRNADFFMFTPLHTGSDLTQYVPMAGHGMESVDPALDFATAIAISGAAVSANMGSSTVRLLSPTLALLNLRLGYWLRNPRSLAEKVDQRLLGGWRRKMITRLKSKFHLMAEMLNMLREDSDEIYLTDGGHLENLGIYELLKRGCALIVAVDAESDPAMAFDSFQRLQRYARIDLGVRIDLPWEGIADTVKAVDKALLDGPQLRSPGPHVAVGRITYADGVEGILIYCKSSISGDEKDYILDYKKRNPAFPHETTGDQFFSEEQFESYRALGFHMIDRFFNDGKEAFGFAPQKTGVFRNKTSLWTEIDRTLPKQQLTGFP